jgi:hypothetical protein
VAAVRFIGRAKADPVNALAIRMRAACLAAVDVDEVAAILEASGINDRVAVREYGASSVFVLAGRVIARALDDSPTVLVDQPDPVAGEPARRLVVDTVVRAALYLTPLAVGLAAASEVDSVPSVAATGTLIVGWGGGQALAYLGYRKLGERGPAAAARLLGAGFAAVATGWCTVLAATGVAGPRPVVVAVTQLAMFSVAAVALVTGRERRVVGYAVPCWLAAGALALGYRRPAVVALLVAVAVLVGCAFAPAFQRTGTRRGGGRRVALLVRWRAWSDDLGRALLFGCVGTGQATLLVSVALDGVAPSHVAPGTVPLLIGVPLIELCLVWHQRRVGAARARLADRAVFERRLRAVSTGTVAVLAVPVVAGGVCAVAVWLGGHPPGGQPLAIAILLTGVYALCLVLAAHRRAGTAATLVWWPALLVLVVGAAAPAVGRVAPHFADTLAAATLLGAGLPGLAVAVLVLRDPESYR